MCTQSGRAMPFLVQEPEGQSIMVLSLPKNALNKPLHVHELSDTTHREGPCFGTPACSRHCAHRTHMHLTETWKQLGALGTVPRKHDAFPRGILRQHGREEALQDKAWLHGTSWATPHKTSQPFYLLSTVLVIIVCKVSFKLRTIISSSS